MIENQGNALPFRVHYTNSGANATGLTVTVNVYDETGTAIVTGASATEIGSGLYGYSLASGSVDAAGLYTAVFDTAGTVDQRNLAGQWHVDVGGIENLDAAVSSRSTLTASSAADAVWDEAMASHTAAGTTGRQLYDQSVLIPGLVDGQTTLAGIINGAAAATIAALTTEIDGVPADILGETLGSYANGTAGGALQRLAAAVLVAQSQYVNAKLQIIVGEDYTGSGVLVSTVENLSGFDIGTGTVHLYVNGTELGTSAAAVAGTTVTVSTTINRADTLTVYENGPAAGAIVFLDGSGDYHTLARVAVQFLDPSVI